LDKILALEREIKRTHFATVIKIKNSLMPEQQMRLQAIQNKQGEDNPDKRKLFFLSEAVAELQQPHPFAVGEKDIAAARQNTIFQERLVAGNDVKSILLSIAGGTITVGIEVRTKIPAARKSDRNLSLNNLMEKTHETRDSHSVNNNQLGIQPAA
jgi:hypothetical protein